LHTQAMSDKLSVPQAQFSSPVQHAAMTDTHGTVHAQANSVPS
jgi:hypothetical protein